MNTNSERRYAWRARRWLARFTFTRGQMFRERPFDVMNEKRPFEFHSSPLNAAKHKRKCREFRTSEMRRVYFATVTHGIRFLGRRALQRRV